MFLVVGLAVSMLGCSPDAVGHTEPVPHTEDDSRTAIEWSRWRARNRKARALAVGGFAGFGAAYLAAIPAGIYGGVGAYGTIPIFGPIGAVSMARPVGYKVFLAVDAVAQVGLLSAGIVGAVRRKRAAHALEDPRFDGLDGRLAKRLHGDSDLFRQRRLGAGLVGGGMGAFGLGYLGMAIAFYSDESDKLVGNDDPVGLWGTVPVAGPFVLAAQTDRPAAKAVAATLGIVQVGGLSVGISGAVLRARGLREAERRVLDDVVVSPWHMERATGFAFAGRF